MVHLLIFLLFLSGVLAAADQDVVRVIVDFRPTLSRCLRQDLSRPGPQLVLFLTAFCGSTPNENLVSKVAQSRVKINTVGVITLYGPNNEILELEVGEWFREVHGSAEFRVPEATTT